MRRSPGAAIRASSCVMGMVETTWSKARVSPFANSSAGRAPGDDGGNTAATGVFSATVLPRAATLRAISS